MGRRTEKAVGDKGTGREGRRWREWEKIKERGGMK